MRKKRGVRFKIAFSIAILVSILMVADAFFGVYVQQRQAENDASEKAQVLAQEMRAAWDFVDINQNDINRNEDGTFRTKTLVCVVASKSISTLFTENTDYTIRFTNTNPRQAANAPDDFEEAALEAFRADPTLKSYAAVETQADGRQVYRYVEPLHITENCLECHGEPAGELDQYHFVKEGKHVGDVGGAMSIIEPMDIYSSGMQKTLLLQIVTVMLVLVVACVGIYFIVSRIVLRPLDSLRTAVHVIDSGSFDYQLPAATKATAHSDEMTEFAHDFDKMARRMERLTNNLESEVESQTVELQQLNSQLVKQQHDLQVALDRLSSETAYKNEFFAIISHELRTPLTSILAFARMLKDDSTLDDKTCDSVNEIESNATLLLNLVNNILAISKTEAHRNDMMVEPVDFVDLVGFVRHALEPIASNKSIELSTKVGADVPLVMADWEKLRRVVENLTDNAIKYTRKGGHVRIRVRFVPAHMSCDLRLDNPAFSQVAPEGDLVAYRRSCQGESEGAEETGASAADAPTAAEAAAAATPASAATVTTANAAALTAGVIATADNREGVVVIEIMDDGMGLHEQDMPAIFDLYRQAGKMSSNRRYKGTGLGLAVVEQLVGMHHGWVDVISAYKVGTTFAVCLPYVPVDTEEYDEDSAH